MRTFRLAILLVAVLGCARHSFAQRPSPVSIDFSFGRYAEFRPNTNLLDQMNDESDWYNFGSSTGYGVAINYWFTQHVFAGANGYCYNLTHKKQSEHRNLNRGHLFAGFQFRPNVFRDANRPNPILFGFQWELGRIGGAETMIEGDTWNHGGTIIIEHEVTSKLSLVVKGSWYWHREDLLVSVVLPRRHRLIGARLGLRYSFGKKEKS